MLKAELGNGSRILALPGTEATFVGIAGADLVVINEAARVEDELLAAVRPMLAHEQRQADRADDPGRQARWFFEIWTGGGEDWSRVRVTADQCPRISSDFLSEELKELGALRFSEEYGLEFSDEAESAFPTAIIAKAFTVEVAPLWA